MSDGLAIKLDDVWVQYRLRHAHHYNLKRTAANVVRGRREPAEVITAIGGLTLSVPRGARLGLVGPNGCGKSTLLAVMAGVLAPTRGTATINGRVLALLGGPDQGLDPEQTGRENAMSLGIRFGESPSSMSERIQDIHTFSGLGPRFDHPVYTYSSGMQVRLRVSTLTALKADVLLVDEGIGQADEEFNRRAAARLAEFFERTGTLILATHSRELAAQFCTEVLDLT